MPYLRLSSRRLDEETKRHLADELTVTVLEILADQKPEWTSVHFTPFDPGDFAIAGRLVADGAIADTHLEISAPEVDEKSWFALRNRLTDILIEALGIPDSERWHVTVKLNRYDLHSFALAGNAADEIEQLAGDTPVGRGPGWRRPAVLLGFGLGAYLGYRWISARVATDAAVDIAPPASFPPGAATDSVAAVAANRNATSEASVVREY
jgi:phenylpyruvate tautomerase PptA (4-oxalocrotonate tautomerase family)